ncbi:MAG: HD domain-containing protein [Bdellovibrionales bacterium]
MQKVFVKELTDKQVVETPFRVTAKHKINDKNGKPFLIIHLSDKSGTIHGMLWDRVEAWDAEIREGEIFQFKGNVQTYQGKLQFVIHTVAPLAADQYELSDFVKSIGQDPHVLFDRVNAFVDSVESPQIKELLKKTLDDETVKDRILKYPAAKTIHHASVGGLIEHICSICTVMDFMAQHYKQLDRDLLIFGAIYHDIGKLWELKIDGGFGYTDRGRLVGHMQIACEMVSKYSQEIDGFTDQLKDILIHIILSHHGRLEYGSPKRPKFLEAMVVAMIDDLDSKIDSVTTYMQSELDNPDGWTRYSAQYDRYFYNEILKTKINEKDS